MLFDNCWYSQVWLEENDAGNCSFQRLWHEPGGIVGGPVAAQLELRP